MVLVAPPRQKVKSLIHIKLAIFLLGAAGMIGQAEYETGMAAIVAGEQQINSYQAALDETERQISGLTKSLR